jgi:5-methylcytosine-specific restriction endonuclease McrA
MRQVLLLNADGEPLGMIPWTRAISLVFKGRVHVYDYFDDVVRSTRESFRLPSVVGLLKYVLIPNRRRISLSKRNVLARDGYECQYCDKELTEKTVTVDHVVPRSQGGPHTWTNVVASCRACNNFKDDKTLEEKCMKLRRLPHVPSRGVILREKAVRAGYEEWKLYFARA